MKRMRMKNYLVLILLGGIFSASNLNAQVIYPKFGKGIQMTAADTSFYLKLGFRFQTLYTNQWDAGETGLSDLGNRESAIFIRRSRLKFDGWAVNKNLKYKAELALSNRDNGGGNSGDFSNAANIILDAFVQYKFYKGLSIRVGQFKMPGNRERVISSGNLQFVDRSRLNSRYTLDRDVGIMFINKHGLGDRFVMKEMLAMSSGEGKNITSGNIGGHAYALRIEALPFGEFQSKGDYIGSAIKYEERPKLSVGVTYDINNQAGRTRGQKGSFISDAANLKDLSSIFVDLMFKHKNLSIMAEYAQRATNDDDPNVYDEADNILATYYMGSGLNLSAGYMLPNNWEIAARWTNITPQDGVANNEVQNTIGLSRYFVGHKLKIQTDATFRSVEDSNNSLLYRIQMDFHF